MDWYSWLSKSNLDPALVYDYSLLFTHNELDQEDIPHFTHDFLLSMGISIAKHRLEIIKLANKFKSPHAVTRVLSAIANRTKNSIARLYFNGTAMLLSSARKNNRSAIVVVPKALSDHYDDVDSLKKRSKLSSSMTWKGSMVRRKRRVVLLKQGSLMITDGGVRVRDQEETHDVGPTNTNGDYNYKKEEKAMRWDSMFQDLKPT